MRLDVYTPVIVPGYGNAGPDHWLTLFEQSHPNACRVNQRNWKKPLRWAWVRHLDAAVQSAPSPVILMGHSLGAMTIVQWAARSRSAAQKVAGALLVAPPDIQARLQGMPPVWMAWVAGWNPIPMKRLPFASILVASSDDLMCSMHRSKVFAQAWGSRFIDVGAAGHIDDKSGYGPWSEVEPLLETLLP